MLKIVAVLLAVTVFNCVYVFVAVFVGLLTRQEHVSLTTPAGKPKTLLEESSASAAVVAVGAGAAFSSPLLFFGECGSRVLHLVVLMSVWTTAVITITFLIIKHKTTKAII